MRLTRRTAIFGLALLAAPPRALALGTGVARRHVEATLDEILVLVVANRPRAETAAALRDIIERRTALAQLARFTAGRAWRDMSEDQRARFTETFARYVSFVFAGQFRQFDGQIDDLRAMVHFLRDEDAGSKGVLVRSEFRPQGQPPVAVDWLVSDRSGRIDVVDVIVEGISMAVTQREIIGAMIEARHGDMERLIADLGKPPGAGRP